MKWQFCLTKINNHSSFKVFTTQWEGASFVCQRNSSPLRGRGGITLIRSSESPEVSKKYARAIILYGHRDIVLRNCVITQDTERDIAVFLALILGCDHWADTVCYTCGCREIIVLTQSQKSFEITLMVQILNFEWKQCHSIFSETLRIKFQSFSGFSFSASK